MKLINRLLVPTIAAAALAASSGFAAVLFDSYGFEAPQYSLGSLTGQNGWVRDGTGVATVQNTVVQSGAQAVSLTGNTTEWHWPDLGYNATPGEFVRASAGILRGSSPEATKNFGFFLDAYNASVQRVARVGLGVSAGAPALVVTALVDGTAGNYLIETGLSWDTWYDVQMDLKFDTQSFDVYLNGVLKASDLSFLVAANSLGDVDLMKSFTTGATDIGYFDNYKVEALLVPEPTAGALLLLGLACFGGRSLLGRRQTR